MVSESILLAFGNYSHTKSCRNDMEELRSYFDAADDIGKKFTDELLRSVFDLDDTGHIWKS